MSLVYRNSHIRFSYPEGWQLDESRAEDGMTVNLQSPSSMFMFLTLTDSSMPPEDLAEQALATMREEYPELESSVVCETIAHVPAVGHDINFFSLDLTNSCWIRAFSSQRHTILIFAQASDLELELGESAFQALCGSIELANDAPGQGSGSQL